MPLDRLWLEGLSFEHSCLEGLELPQADKCWWLWLNEWNLYLSFYSVGKMLLATCLKLCTRKFNFERDSSFALTHKLKRCCHGTFHHYKKGCVGRVSFYFYFFTVPNKNKLVSLLVFPVFSIFSPTQTCMLCIFGWRSTREKRGGFRETQVLAVHPQ